MNTLRDRFPHVLRRYLAALHHGTRLPLAGALSRWGGDAEPPAAVAPHEPGVGLLVGMAACLVFAVASLPLPDTTAGALAAALLSTMAALLLTGAAQEEALARSVQRLAPLDAQARGILVLLLAIALKVALLAVLAGQSAAGVLAALVGAHAVSRFWPLVLRHAVPFTADDGKVEAPPSQRGGLVVAALWCLPALLLMLLAGGAAFVLFPLLASALAFVVLVRRYRPHLQAVTRDSLGATQQVCEAAFYLGAALALRG